MPSATDAFAAVPASPRQRRQRARGDNQVAQVSSPLRRRFDAAGQQTRRHRRVRVRQRRVQIRGVDQERLGLGPGGLGGTLARLLGAGGDRAETTRRRRRPGSTPGRADPGWSRAGRGPMRVRHRRGRRDGDACAPVRPRSRAPRSSRPHPPPTWHDSRPRAMQVVITLVSSSTPRPGAGPVTCPASPRPPWHVARPPISSWLLALFNYYGCTATSPTASRTSAIHSDLRARPRAAPTALALVSSMTRPSRRCCRPVTSVRVAPQPPHGRAQLPLRRAQQATRRGDEQAGRADRERVDEVARERREAAPREREPGVVVEAAAGELEVVGRDEQAAHEHERNQQGRDDEDPGDADPDRAGERDQRERDQRPTGQLRLERSAVELVERVRADPDREEERDRAQRRSRFA